MGIKYRLIVLLLALLANTLSGADRYSNLLIGHLTLEDGLPNSKVNAIAKDKHGFMWFGTNDGVCRYDGFDMLLYPLDQLTGEAARTPQISVLKSNTDGQLLIGSYSLFRYNYQNDQIEQCGLQQNQLQHPKVERVYAIEPGPNGLFYIGANNGLFTYDFNKDQLSALSTEEENYQILSLCPDGDQLWLGTKKSGLVNYHLSNKKFEKITDPSFPAEEKNQILCFFPFNENTLWMGTQNNGIATLNKADNTFRIFYVEEEQNLSLRVRKIIRDPWGSIWAGTRGGLYLYDEGHFVRKAYQEHPVSSLMSTSVYDIMIDEPGTMWMGTYSGGVNYINLQRKPFEFFNPVQGYASAGKSNITCFAEDEQGNLWIGTEDFGLLFKENDSNNFERFAPGLTGYHSLSNSSVKALAIDQNGQIWVGTYNSGLHLIDPKTKSNQRLHTQNSDLIDDYIKSIQIDSLNQVWVGTMHGLGVLKKGQQIASYFHDQEVQPVYIDAKQQIWTGAGSEGLFRYNAGLHSFEPVFPHFFNSTIRCLLLDSEENLWVGNNKGLYHIDLTSEKITSYGLNEGLPSLRINGLLEDKQKNLWVSTGAGLLKFNHLVAQTDSINISTFSIDDGLHGKLFRQNAYLKNKNGVMYFGGDWGYNRFVPENILPDEIPPRLAFTKLKIFGRTVEVNQELDGLVVLPASLNELDKIDLSYQHRMLTIEFIAFSYNNPLGVQYRYRLLPFQKEWIYTSGLRNFATYSNLKGGRYTFQLEAANDDGIWNSTGKEINMVVHPPFWAELWFIVMVSALFIGLIIASYYYRIVRLNKLNLALEKKVNERTAELKRSYDQLVLRQTLISRQSEELNQQKEKLQELNSTKDKFFSIIAHDLKNPFQSILGMTGLLENTLTNHPSEEVQLYLKELSKSSKVTYSLLDNLLTWASTQSKRIAYTPEKIDLNQLIDNAIQLLEQNFSKKDIRIERHSTASRIAFADSNMIATVLRNLINNAIKFTPKGGKISISVKEEKQMLKVEVSDTGTGIPPDLMNSLFRIDQSTSRPGTEGEKGTGLGLIICKEFVEKNGGSIGVSSRLNRGSCFYFTVPKFKQT
ncbi:two-component regulator propeller domain-containing protein [Roseimarinus sediminis]|uniref:two-component regulator propeller domain-containing protein n=1 Tax=Roseimarinus sediminis TaxID=1610899 RepID=UPI003D1B02D2